MVNKKMAAYNQDRAAAFMAEQAIKDVTGKVQAATLHRAYEAWANDNASFIMTPCMFGRVMEDAGYMRTRRNDAVYWLGIRLKDGVALAQAAEKKEAPTTGDMLILVNALTPSISAFAELCTYPEPNEMVCIDDMYAAYEAWAVSNAGYYIDIDTLGQVLRKLGYQRRQIEGTVYWTGLHLRAK
jgi:uncharacterized protein Smg (DUF494 family)